MGTELQEFFSQNSAKTFTVAKERLNNITMLITLKLRAYDGKEMRKGQGAELNLLCWTGP